MFKTLAENWHRFLESKIYCYIMPDRWNMCSCENDSDFPFQLGHAFYSEVDSRKACYDLNYKQMRIGRLQRIFVYDEKLTK